MTNLPQPPGPPPRPSWRRSFWAWCADYALVLTIAGFLAVVAVVFMQRVGQSEWEGVFVRAARRMQDRQPIHVAEDRAYAYPPLMAMLTIPFAHLSPRVGMFAWYLVNALASVVTLVAAFRLAGGPSLVRPSRSWRAVFFLAMLLNFRFLLAPLSHQQFETVIAAMAMAGGYCLWRGHDMRAAVLFGLSAAMKCTPLLLAPYLVWRGKLRAAALMVAVALGVNLLPDWFWPRGNNLSYLVDWQQSFLGVVAHAAPGTWHADPLQNQSLAGMLGRYAQYGWPTSRIELAELIPAPVAKWPLRLAVYGSGLILLGTSVYLAGRRGRPTATPAARDGRERPFGELQTPAELAAAFCLMLLLSPMSSKYHYVITLLPAMLISRAIVERRSRALRWLLIPLIAFGSVSAKDLIGTTLGNLTMMWGLPTWYAITMLIATWIVLAKVQAASATDTQPLEVTSGV